LEYCWQIKHQRPDLSSSIPCRKQDWIRVVIGYLCQLNGWGGADEWRGVDLDSVDKKWIGVDL
jgi:hypothetical protein